MEKKVLVVEFNNWHDECLYTACSFLRAEGCSFSLVLNEKLEKRVGKEIYGDEEPVFLPFKGLGNMFSSFRKIRRMLKDGGYTHLYLNTAQGSVAWKFFLYGISSGIKVSGVIHNIAKLDGSFGQRVITRRIDHYVLLNDILLDSYRKRCKKPVSVLYPVDYPEYASVAVDKPDNEVWIAVPGEMSLMRRDYNSIIYPGAVYDRNVKFIFLCNSHRSDGEELLARIGEYSLNGNMVTFDKFVDNAVFFSYIKKCDYIMPLVCPSKEVYAKYLTDKISGTYNIAFAYRKVMLCPKEMAVYEDFSDTSLFYDETAVCDFVNSLKPMPDAQAFYKLKKWGREYRYESAKGLL